MNATSHLCGAQLLSLKGFMWNFITTSETEILLEALEEASNIVLELCTYQQSKEAIPQDFIHINSHSVNLKCCSCTAAKLGGFKSKELKASVVKSELSEAQSVIIFPTYQDYSLNAATVVSLHVKDILSVQWINVLRTGAKFSTSVKKKNHSQCTFLTTVSGGTIIEKFRYFNQVYFSCQWNWYLPR